MFSPWLWIRKGATVLRRGERAGVIVDSSSVVPLDLGDFVIRSGYLLCCFFTLNQIYFVSICIPKDREAEALSLCNAQSPSPVLYLLEPLPTTGLWNYLQHSNSSLFIRANLFLLFLSPSVSLLRQFEAGRGFVSQNPSLESFVVA